MSTFQILSLLGVGSIAASVITYLATVPRKTTKRIKALCLGVQAVLRSRMIEMYNRYSDEEFAPLYVKEDFNNCWVQYEALGANGVMSDVYKRFMAFPDSPHKGKEQEK